jgi:transcriptional regulator of aromatic amino acid metabolism
LKKVAIPSMRRVLTPAKTIAGSHFTVLLRGETGAGKEILARPRQAASSRAEKTFIRKKIRDYALLPPKKQGICNGKPFAEFPKERCQWT